ncbi:hypothetical protein ABH920_008762 [Catenulispora sp. EB89]|uniref:hypothetical protein n=1 Tax=Catenulispora sp. EB89 TaxID=3156257 RepID=UPI0035156868
MKRTRVVILGGAAVVVLAAGTAVAATQLGHHGTGTTTTLPTANCGSATARSVDASTVVTMADPGALTCFTNAARACQPAAVQIVARGVDAGTDYVFKVQSGGKSCRVTESSQTYVEPGRHGPVRSVTCDQTGVTDEGVTLACGGQDVLVPSAGGGHERPMAG